jgi:hypothetical protein
VKTAKGRLKSQGDKLEAFDHSRVVILDMIVALKKVEFLSPMRISSLPERTVPHGGREGQKGRGANYKVLA